MSTLHPPILPPATIGMLGGGQLGRYALIAAKVMGYRTIVLDPDPRAPAGVVADEHLVAPYDDPAALARLAEACAVVTTEFENPPAAALDVLADSTRVAPSPSAVRVAQDRIAEKSFLTASGLPVGRYAVLDPALGGVEQVPSELADGGVVVKTARLGYDGKGQRRVTGIDAIEEAWNELGRVACVVEALLDLRTEVSVIVGRSPNGDTRTWPVAENTHVDGILDVSIVPAPIDPMLTDRAVQMAIAVADELDYVGVLAVEMFVVGPTSTGPSDAADLFVNEMAPRPHNSGHWTLDGSVTSQYEQQIRAICGLGLGATDPTSPGVAMVNLLGDRWPPQIDGAQIEPNWTPLLGDPAAKLHLYGKVEARPGRKMGHLTVLGGDVDEAAKRAVALRNEL